MRTTQILAYVSVTGERITLHERIDDNWWEGEVRGQVGIFPHSYIQVQAFPSSST